jgi:hypothetical protein
MCLRLVFLLVTRIAAWLRLSRREEEWKTAEILVGAENLCHLARCSAGRWLFSPVGTAWAWDDLRLVGLKLIFLVVTRVVSLLGLSRREWWWKDAEILMLRTCRVPKRYISG